MRSLFLISLLTLSTALFAQIPVDGLIAKYTFDVDANDQFNNYHGTLMGDAETNISLNIGWNAEDALLLPGLILNSVNEFSITLDIRFTGFITNHQWASNVVFSGASSLDDNLMNFAYAKDQLHGGSATLQNTVFYVHDDVRYEFNDIELDTGKWYHITLVRGENILKFYIDGIEQAPIGGISVPTLNLSLDPAGFIFGQDQDVLTGGFVEYQCLNGSMDNLLIYNRLLIGDEVMNIYKSIQLGINSNDIEESTAYSIYPNPAQDILNIKYPNNNDKTESIAIFNVTGKIIHSIIGSTESINISSLETGVYFISITTESGLVKRCKFLKQ